VWTIVKTCVKDVYDTSLQKTPHTICNCFHKSSRLCEKSTRLMQPPFSFTRQPLFASSFNCKRCYCAVAKFHLPAMCARYVSSTVLEFTQSHWRSKPHHTPQSNGPQFNAQPKDAFIIGSWNYAKSENSFLARHLISTCNCTLKLSGA